MTYAKRRVFILPRNRIVARLIVAEDWLRLTHDHDGYRAWNSKLQLENKIRGTAATAEFGYPCGISEG